MEMDSEEIITEISEPIYKVEADEAFNFNITNPNSTYIRIELKFKGYIKYHLHAYIDTGAGLTLCSKYVVPEDCWTTTPRPIKVIVADGRQVEISKVTHDLNINIGGMDFRIPTVYQQISGNTDFLIGNNFLRLYAPFTQYRDRISLYNRGQRVITNRVIKAYAYATPDFMEKQRKPRKRGEKIPKTNIVETKEKPDFDQLPSYEEIGSILLYTMHEPVQKTLVEDIEYVEYCMKIHHQQELERVLSECSSDNPLDIDMNKLLKNPKEYAEIKLKDPDKVIRVKPMIYTPTDKEFFRKEIKDLLDKKVIRESKSPHSSPAFLVENHSEVKRGKKRMVVNYKKLNSETVDDGYYLPKKEELIGQIRGKKYFSSFDCKSGFWQIPLKEESRALTAFSCPSGQYEWNVIPFGLKQAPGLFQRHIDTKLDLKDPSQEIGKYCIVYVDDILVFSDTEKDHYGHVINVLKKCKEKGIILSKSKVQLAQTKINFLGLEITEGSHKLQDHILNKIHSFPSKITSINQLQRFLGCLTYAEGYIPKLAEKRKPLQAKLKKGIRFEWTDEDTRYVDKLKKSFGTLPELYHPKETDYMILETDASNDAWGAVLKAIPLPEEEGNLKPIEKLCRYTSGAFQGAEINYHTNEKETLAVKKAIKKFTIYLLPAPFTVRCDNKYFSYFLRTHIAGDYKQGRLIRWQQWFNHYQFKVEHIEGKNNCLADTLTREFSCLRTS